jgi:hypothetical protein
VSKRPTNEKKIRGIRKLMRQTPTAYIDLIEWLRSRGHADTAGAARRLIKSGRVQSESHPLGRNEVQSSTIFGVERLFGNPRVPASMRDTIVVRKARKS